MTRVLKVANASAFWGDQPEAAARLVAAQPDIDYLTLDYLAEVSLSIMAIQRQKDPAAGYARDFLDVLRSLAPFWLAGGRTRIVTNAGGLDPTACARATRSILDAAHLKHLRLAVITGDDVLSLLAPSGAPPLSNPIGYTAPRDALGECNPIGDILPGEGEWTEQSPDSVLSGCHLLSDKPASGGTFANLETGEPFAMIAGRLVTANAYVGAGAIAAALRAGADIVITGRTADPSLTVGPCLANFGWTATDYDRIAGATVAGHLIECGTQACGGFSTDWLGLPGAEDIGFPVAEIFADGSCVLTKPPGTGGAVTMETIREQALYEIGDPGNYLSPDATVSFLTLALERVGPDRIRVSSASGGPPPPTLKVSATYRDGYKAHGMLTIFGHAAVATARRAGEGLLQKLAARGCRFREMLVECLGAGASVPGVVPSPANATETVLRISVAADSRDPVERFTREIASLVTCGPQGVTGYATGRPKVLPIFGYWPCLIERDRVSLRTEWL